MPNTALPLVTVVLPIRNEAAFIARCFDALAKQDYPSDRMEVVIADGMSTDGTRDIVAAACAQHATWRMIDNPGRIVPTGLNAAMAAARGEIIARVDGHCEIAPDYIRRCVQHLQNGVDAVGGPLETVGETQLANAIALAMSSTFGVGNSAFRTVADMTMSTDSVAFPAYRRAVVDKLGPFDEELVRNQDDEYNYRLRKAGGRILLAADVRSRYFSRSSIRSLWRQYFQYGYWKVRVLQKHPRQMCARQFVPPLFAAAVGGSVLALPFTGFGIWLLIAVVGGYLLANAYASTRVARGNAAVLRMVSVAFATLHVAYGSGFLYGLLRFFPRWFHRGIA